MTSTRQRDDWNRSPVDLGHAWVLHKREKVARCSLVTHPFGWELRLITPTCRVPGRPTDEILATHERWKAAMCDAAQQFTQGGNPPNSL